MDKSDSAIALVVVVGLAALVAPYATLGVDLHHDGIMLKPALDVLSGQTLFRDTFMQYGAMTCYLQVAALMVFPSLLSLRLMAVGAYAVSLFFLYASWRQILPRSLTVVACAMYVFSIPLLTTDFLLPWSSVYALMFQSIGLYSLFQVIRAKRPVWWSGVLGMACACAFWCRQPVGIVMTGSVAVIWLMVKATGGIRPELPGRRIEAWMVGGFFIVSGVLLANIWASGAWPAWWYQNFVWPERWATEGLGTLYWSPGLQRYVQPLDGILLLLLLVAAALPGLVRKRWGKVNVPMVTVYYGALLALVAWQHDKVFLLLHPQSSGWSGLIPVLVMVQAVVSLVKAIHTRGEPKSTEFLLVAALAGFSLGSLTQYYPIVDPWHIFWSLAPAYGLVVYLIWRRLEWRAPVLALVLIVGFLPAIRSEISGVRAAIRGNPVTLEAPRALHGMRVSPAQARLFGEINQALAPVLKRLPNIPSALLGRDAMYLCFTRNTQNPIPYFVTWRGLADQRDEQRRWQYIHDVRPLLFIEDPDERAVKDFFRRTGYASLAHLPDAKLEIAVPAEILSPTGSRSDEPGPAFQPAQ